MDDAAQLTQLREEVEFLRKRLSQPIEVSVDQRSAMLVNEAQRWVGIQEVGGNNRGQLVEIFLKQAGLPRGNPWCMAFVQYCVHAVDGIAFGLNRQATISRMAAGAHCLSVWHATPSEYRSPEPWVGSVAIWRKKGSSAGHTGIVSGVGAEGRFTTIEGNTSPGTGVEREGDGVFEKIHSVGGKGTMELVGFILPWGKS